jgi:hypothetical protein
MGKYMNRYNFSAIVVGEWWASRPSGFTRGERTPHTHTRLSMLQCQYWRHRQWKNSWRYRDSNSDNLGSAVRSQSLYRLRYYRYYLYKASLEILNHILILSCGLHVWFRDSLQVSCLGKWIMKTFLLTSCVWPCTWHKWDLISAGRV